MTETYPRRGKDHAVNGSITSVVPSFVSLSALAGPKDIVFHATKAPDTIAVKKRPITFANLDALSGIAQ